MINQEEMQKALEWRRELLNKKYEDFDQLHDIKDQWMNADTVDKTIYKGVELLDYCSDTCRNNNIKN